MYPLLGIHRNAHVNAKQEWQNTGLQVSCPMRKANGGRMYHLQIDLY